jgi:hypothetical protein
LPDTSLAFLILGDNGIFSLYIGVRGRGRISALQDFVASNWKGVISKKSDNDPTLKGFFETDKYEKCHILTGVPTLNAQDQYAHGIDQIIGGSKQHKHIAYLVTATPIAEENIDGILTECREIQSQAESFKGFSISESLQKSESTSDSHTVAETITETVSNEVKQNDGKAVRNTILAVTGLAVAAAILYPPALAIVPQAAQRINFNCHNGCNDSWLFRKLYAICVTDDFQRSYRSNCRTSKKTCGTLSVRQSNRNVGSGMLRFHRQR